jgi:glycosyltransferase involved in cell wall biosynthesis
MKILIICPDWFPNISGFGISAYEFSQELLKDKHEVTIITSSQKNLDKKGLNVVSVKMLFNPLGRNPIVFGLYNKIKNVDYDVILLYSYMYEMNVRVALYRKLGLIKKPVILMYRGSLENDVLPFLKTSTKIAKKTYDATLARMLFKNVDYTISNSKPTLKLINEKYLVSHKKMSYISSGIPVMDFKRSKLSNKRVLFNGRLIENKGINFFGKILETIPKDWKFTIIGDGPLEKEILRLKKKYKNIEYLGKVSHAVAKEMYSKADILILPTFAEGSPRVVLEACASGVPSIAFNVGDVPTILDNNKNGYCIERYNIEKFTEKLELLIKNRELRKKLGDNAYTFARKNLDWKIVYKKMLKEIRGLL